MMVFVRYSFWKRAQKHEGRGENSQQNYHDCPCEVDTTVDMNALEEMGDAALPEPNAGQDALAYSRWAGF